MIKVFKWWWAWDYEEIEDWLEKMEMYSLKLVDARMNGVVFCFEKCVPAKARYCIDYQSKLTPEYIALMADDGWQIYPIGSGWYILRKEYEEERPNLYNGFEGLVERNKLLLRLVIAATLVEFAAFGIMILDVHRYYSVGKLASTCILGSLVLALFTFIITNLALQISKFSKKE